MKKLLEYFIKLPVFAQVDATTDCKRISWLFAVVAVSTVTGFQIPFLGSLYIPICAASLLYILACGKLRIDVIYVLMYIAFGVSALLAFEPLFNSHIRYMLFLCITLLGASCLSSPTAIAFRSLVYRNILILLTFLTVGSFICFFLGFNLVRRDLAYDTTTAGVFGGLYAHSMLLGPFSVLVALMFLNTYLAHRKWIAIVMFFVAASAVLMSASRGATLALAVPIAYLLFFMKNVSNSRKKLIGLLLLSSIAVIPISDKISAGLIQKQQLNVAEGSTFNSRESKWNNRIQEFKENPVFGIGFCSVNPKYSGDYNSSGGVEAGSSHLSVLSMTGAMGIISYLLVICSAYLSVFREKNAVAKMRMCTFLAMITHAFFEGYALYAGGLLCFVYWLAIGLCVDYKKMNNYNLLK